MSGLGARVGGKAAFVFRPFWGLVVGLGALVGFLVPKDPQLWVFGNFKGFSDNTRYLFEHVAAHYPSIRPVWLSRSVRDRDAVRHLGYESELIGSLSGLITAYRAGVAVLLNGSRDLNRAALPSQFVVNLWHGTPFKRVLMDSHSEGVRIPIIGGALTRLGRAALKVSLRTNDVIIAPSNYVGSLLASAFRVNSERIAVTGTPRADIIVEEASRQPKPETDRVLLAPTWRGPGREGHVFESLDATVWNELLHRCGAVLTLKLHPLVDESGLELSELDEECVERLPSSMDINPILGRFSVLITDYSAIAFDFAVLGRPIFFVCPDEEQYDRAWGLYEPMQELVGEALYRDYDAVTDALERALIRPDDYPMEVPRRLAGPRFLRFTEGGACGRVLDEISRKSNREIDFGRDVGHIATGG